MHRSESSINNVDHMRIDTESIGIYHNHAPVLFFKYLFIYLFYFILFYFFFFWGGGGGGGVGAVIHAGYQLTGSSLVQEMTWCLFGTKSFPEPMMTNCQLTL